MSTAIATRENELALRSLRALPHSLTTSSVCAVDESGSRPVLTRHSTSPSRMRNFELIIVDSGIAMRALSVEHEWVIERFEGEPKALGVERVAERAPVLDTAGDIAWLRQNLEIGMGDIASLFGVTRKTVYDWTNGSKAINAGYIKAVRTLIEQGLDAESRPYLRQFWEFGSSGEEPLLDILKSCNASRLNTDAARALRALARPIADYVQKIHAGPDGSTAAHIHNYDEYRNL